MRSYTSATLVGNWFEDRLIPGTDGPVISPKAAAPTPAAAALASSSKLLTATKTATPDELANYRQRWLNDGDPRSAAARFTVETVASSTTGVPKHLIPPSTRFFRGTVKGLDAMRNGACRVYGSGGVVHIVTALPESFTLIQLSKGLERIGITLSVDEGEDLWRGLDPDRTGVCTRDVLMGLLTSHGLPPPRGDIVDLAWRVLLHLGHGRVTVAHVLRYFDAEQHPDVKARRVTAAQVRGTMERVLQWVGAGEPPAPPIIVHQREAAAAATALLKGQAAADVHDVAAGGGHESPGAGPLLVSQATFHRAYTLLSAGHDLDVSFVEGVIAAWHLYDALHIAPLVTVPRSIHGALLAAARHQHGLGGGEDGSPATTTAGSDGSGIPGLPQQHVLVIATYEDGRRGLEKVPADGFLRRDDKADLLARLHAAGVVGVVDVEIDF